MSEINLLLPRWKAQTALRKLLAAGAPGQIHRSRRGVPLIVLRGSTGAPNFASVCWFRRTRKFRFFESDPSNQGQQIKTDEVTLEGAVRRANEIAGLVHVAGTGHPGVYQPIPQLPPDLPTCLTCSGSGRVRCGCVEAGETADCSDCQSAGWRGCLDCIGSGVGAALVL